MSGAETDWAKYGRWNRRDERMAELWVRDVIAWVNGNGQITSNSVVLDYGCGYFDVGMALAPHVARVDGFDIEPDTIAAARMRVRSVPNAQIHDRRDDLPRASYDLVIVNSVLQYVPEGELGDALTFMRGLLKPGGAALIADLIPRSYSPAKDALRSLWVALRSRLLLPMIMHISKAALKPDGLQLSRIDAAELSELASAARFRFERLERNLTPSRQRYSCLLKAA